MTNQDVANKLREYNLDKRKYSYYVYNRKVINQDLKDSIEEMEDLK